METQKRLEVQLLAITELASSIFSQSAPQKEGLSAITLRSGTQLRGPSGESLDFAPITHEGTNTQRGIEHKEVFCTTEHEGVS
ncbi:hypothetical protein PIB30_094336, partial [Stylosanthes scabra]|nr:hypothetical protein [Stylosanthes scabra]